MPRRRAVLSILLVAAAATAIQASPALAQAPAPTPLSVVARAALSADRAVQRTCFAAPLKAGAAGADVREVTAPATGLFDVRLDGSPYGADWDLAVFGPGGRLLGGSAAFGGREVVRAPVTAGDTVTVQACRYGTGVAPALQVGLVLVGPLPKREVESLVRIRFNGREDLRRLVALDIDLNEVARGGSIDAVLHGPADARRLREAGFAFTTRIADLAAYDRRTLREPARSGSRALPSGRTGYRTLEEYQMDLKRLVDEHPGLVRPVILPRPSVEGRTIEGIEIAEGVDRTDDGRPVHVQMGLHHVREWPSGEVVTEFAIDLAKGYAAGNARIQTLLRRTRTFLFPVINPDGLVATMPAGAVTTPADDSFAATLGLAAAGTGAYRRKNCAPGPGQQAIAPCATKDGVDLNRNYGAFWGGPGASEEWTSQTFRGPSPFSEPEAQAVHEWSSRHHVMVINSNHTYARDFLYQPGFARTEPGLPQGTDLPYKARMVALSDAMANAAGYVSMVSYNLYDVTGATEDWNYFSQGAFGYTTEIAYDNFHPNYQDGVIDEYTGSLDGALNSANDALRPSQGLREAFLLAGEATADATNHAIVAGAAPAGRVLRLTKDFQTTTSYVMTGGVEGDPMLIPEHFETTLTVPSSGRFEWHVNPSTRPLQLIAGRTEAWTMSCEGADGHVFETRNVTVGIGQTITQDFASCGGAIVPSSVPSGTVTQTGAQPGAAAAKASRLRIGAVSRTRRFARSGRRLQAWLAATGARPLTTVRATLRDAAGRVRATGRRTRITSRGRVILRAARSLKAGRYVLKVTARSPSGAPVRASRTVRLGPPGRRART